MQLEKIDRDFTICKIKDAGEIDFTQEYCFLGKTDEELSLVCAENAVPHNTIEREDGWRGFRIQGILDFSLTGILSAISAVLADHQIGIFAISTYNTDYIFVKKGNYAKALHVLGAAGYDII